MPISDFHGLMSLQVGLFMKSCLWSFSVMNESLDAEASIRSSSSSFSAIFLSFKVCLLVGLCNVFAYKCYVVVGFMQSCNNLSFCLLSRRCFSLLLFLSRLC